ncbi:TspO/MBR family protein [Dichotomicrobium thermohalophilum]|uniref:TspO/MBR related protein n=1 Tax=Dichotomicrobium thermohalophilum TaxID=933063 RepID=A0A397Q5F4_9HYPH|nr:TspO/MBR family protein [Dichotomicrobium thermohalophilum]RIA56710.1 TspO/MBR related protein [Dichotomicrobium thermohalophilum]
MTDRATRMSALWTQVLAAGAAAVVVAVLGSTMTDIGPWYQSLEKPSFQPPDWAFGPAWTIIFALAALAGVTAWRAADGVSREWIIGLFALNGTLNVLWTVLFFRLQRPDWALIEVVFLWLSVLALLVYLGRFSKLAGALIVPYLLWVAFAGVVNYQIVQLNGPF